MMLIPRRNEFDLLEDMLRDPFFNNHENKVMKTDIKEKENQYVIDIEIPSYDKENIKMSIENGYLTIEATLNEEHDAIEEGRFIRRERYLGSCARSFYVGDNIEQEDIKANLKNGVLRIEIPKKTEQKGLSEKKYIEIDS